MKFELVRTIENDDPTMTIEFGADFLPCKQGVAPAGVIEAWMRPLNGEDEKVINDAMIQMNRKGNSEVKAGTTEQLKVCRSIVKLRGMTLNGDEVETLSASAYAVAPKWIIDRFAKKVKEINGEFDDGSESD